MERLRGLTGPSGARVFGFRGGAAFCTCPAFPSQRRCFHTVGLAIFWGKIEALENLDCSVVSFASRGNKRKAPARGAVPLLADQKDERIAELEAKLRKLTKQKMQLPVEEETGPVPVSEEEEPEEEAKHSAPIQHTWKPHRRLWRKTPFPGDDITPTAVEEDDPFEAQDGVPPEVHEKTRVLVSGGVTPYTTLEQRSRQYLVGGSSHGALAFLKAALKLGYISPNLPAPTGYTWRSKGGGLFLALSTTRGLAVCRVRQK